MNSFRFRLFNIYQSLSSAYGVRALIMTNDLILSSLAFFMAILLRHNLDFPNLSTEQLLTTFGLVLLVKLSMFRLFKTYAGIIRFTGTQDILMIIKALTLSTVALLGISLVLNSYELLYIPISVLLIDLLLSLTFQVGSRIVMQLVYANISRGSKPVENVAIFGAGACGDITRNAIMSDTQSGMRVVAFFDDSKLLKGKSMGGLPIYQPKKHLEEAIEKYNIKRVVIAIEQLSLERKRDFVERCLAADIEVMVVPPVTKWLNDELQAVQIRNINIEDLLNRKAIKLVKEHIADDIRGKVVLVTGAAGSIGSEIARQLASYQPKKLVILDQAESPLWEQYLHIKESHKNADFLEAELGDVRNEKRMDDVFQRFRPDFVFHAAAYKHVPILESFPKEAIRVNVLGTKTVAELAMRYSAQKFVFVSTDKAVNPTNVMGASKRIAEIYVQALGERGSTKFITTRFGNVLGSNGSVVPRFQKQIEAGGPITVTHKDITRYFMTIPEACQLVLEAGIMGNGGEIFVFDMGEPVKISDLAIKMIRLAGLKEKEDIDIIYTGLREGEKLYEELLSNKENTLPTHHDKIMIGKARRQDYASISYRLSELSKLMTDDAVPDDIVACMKDIVPEFISNSSRYEKIDQRNKKLNGTAKSV